MAVRIDAQTDRLYATIGLPTGSTYTVLGWIYISTVQVRYTNFFLFSGGSNNFSVGTLNDGVRFNLGDNTTDSSGITMSAATWYRVAAVVTGTTAVGYIATATGTFSTVNMTLGSGAFTPTSIYIGGDGYTPTVNTSWLNGRVAGVKIYNAALTAAEVELELSQYQPSRTTSLTRYHPFVISELIDYSGNGTNLTAGTTSTATEDGPPLRWARSRGPRVKKSAVLAPADALNIGTGPTDSHWTLQVARTGDGAILVKTLAELEAGYTESPYLYTTPAGLVHLEARLDAPTTSGSAYSRCEWREANADGTDIIWDPRVGEHIMSASTIITSLPTVKPDLVYAQVFGIDTTADIMSLRTQLVSGTIRMRTRIDSTSVTSPQMANPYVVGTRVNWKIRFIDGVRESYWSFDTDPIPGTPQITAAVTTDTGAYFKHGAYNQSNVAAGDAGTAIGAVELVPGTLTVFHAFPVVADVSPIDITTELPAIDAAYIADIAPVDTTVEIPAVDPAWISDVIPIDITVQPIVIDPAYLDDVAPIDVTVETPTVTTERVQVIRPDPVDATVEIPVVTFARGKILSPVDTTVQLATITWPRVLKPLPIDITVERPAIGVRLTNVVRPSPIDITVEQPTAVADVISQIFVDLDAVDITVQTVSPSVSVVKSLSPIDITTQATEVDPVWVTDANAIDITTEIPAVTTRVTKNIGYVDIAVESLSVKIGETRDLDPIDFIVETLAVETDHIVKPAPVDVTVELPVVKTIRTSYGIGAINTTVEILAVDAANIVDVTPVDIIVEQADVDYYRTITLQPVEIDAGPLDVSLIQSSYSIGYIDITIDTLQARITRDYDVDAIDITIETADVVMGQVKPVPIVDTTVETTTASAVSTNNIRNLIEITVEAADPLQLEYVAKVSPIDIVVQPANVGVTYVHTIGVIDIVVQPAKAAGITVKLLGIIDVTVDPSGFTQALHQTRPISVPITVEAAEIDPAIVAGINPIDITVSPRPVVTFFSKMVAPVDVTVQPTVMPTLQRILKMPAFDINSGPLQWPKLLKIADVNPIDVTLQLPNATASSFDDTPIDITIDVLEVTVGFSVEDFFRIKDLPRPAFVQPTRVIAQDILTKRFLHWELPVSNLSITYTLSGAKVINGEFSNEILDLRDLGLEAWATWIHIEEDGVIRGSGILQPSSLDENETLSLEAVGVSAYPSGQPFDSSYEGINLDPADIMRAIWAHLQTYPDAQFGVQVTGSTTVKLGKPLPPPPPNPLPEDYVEPDNKNDKPYQLVWWEATDCGSEINSLAQESPFDFVERDVWNADKTDVLHYIDIGFPRIGSRRTDLSFVQEENMLKAIGPEETDEFYASSVILLGKGEGSSMIRGYAGRPYKNRVRRTVILDDSTVDNVTRANALCMKELDRRQALTDVKEVEIDARHPNARLGSFGVGDDIPLRATVPWYGDINQWERVLSYTYYPENETIRVQLRRSEAFVYGTGS